MPDLEYRFEVFEETSQGLVYRCSATGIDVETTFEAALALAHQYQIRDTHSDNYSIVSKFGELKL